MDRRGEGGEGRKGWSVRGVKKEGGREEERERTEGERKEYREIEMKEKLSLGETFIFIYVLECMYV